MKMNHTSLLFILLFSLVPSPVRGDISPIPGTESLPSLFSKADVVVKGEITQIRQGPTISSRFNGHDAMMNTFRATLRTDRTYKGIPQAAITIDFMTPEGNACVVSFCLVMHAGEYELFFLLSSGTDYQLIDNHWGKFPASRLNVRSDNTGLSALRADLIAGIDDSDERASVSSVELFAALEHVPSTRPLNQAFPQAQPVKKLAILEAMIRLGDYQLLPSLKALFEDSEVAAPQAQSYRYRVCLRVEQIRDSSAAPALVALARTSSPQLRESAIHALREIGSSEAIPTLVAALDDPVELIRYDAVLGLATLERNWDLAPSVATFRGDEKKYISAWKNWAADNHVLPPK